MLDHVQRLTDPGRADPTRTRCYTHVPSFVKNLSTGSGEDFSMVFTIYGHGSHLNHVTSIPYKESLLLSKTKTNTTNHEKFE